MAKKKQTQADLDDDYKQGSYVVKQILNYREGKDGSDEFLVWWEGYGYDEATWEPAKSFEGFDDWE